MMPFITFFHKLSQFSILCSGALKPVNNKDYFYIHNVVFLIHILIFKIKNKLPWIKGAQFEQAGVFLICSFSLYLVFFSIFFLLCVC